MTKTPPPLSDDAISSSLSQLPGWERDGGSITKTFKLDKYLTAFAFAATVGTIAEGLDHHPDIHIGWKKVTVTFSTHSAGHVVTEKDIEAAAAIEGLPYKPQG